MVKRLPRVLFVCVGNAGRSQMAQAFYEARGGEARSAGSRPESGLHPPVAPFGCKPSKKKPGFGVLPFTQAQRELNPDGFVGIINELCGGIGESVRT